MLFRSTESITNTERGKVEGVLSAMPYVALLVVSGGFGIIIDLVGYPMFFTLLGLLVTLCGVIGIFTVKESATPVVHTQDTWWGNMMLAFKVDTIRANKCFYFACLVLCIQSIAVQIFMPYLLIYLNNTLGLSVVAYSIVMAVAIVITAVVSVCFGRWVDKKLKPSVIGVAVVIFALGLVAMYFVKGLGGAMVAGTIMLIGMSMLSIIGSVKLRNHTPTGKVGSFQGIRLLFMVMIPMIIGPQIGASMSEVSGGTYINEFQEVVALPAASIFLAAAVCALLVIIPFGLLLREEAKTNGSTGDEASVHETNM